MKKILFFLFPCLFVFLFSCSDDQTLLTLDTQSSTDDVLAPCSMTRAEALNLVLSQGVGYGYNAVEGEECNVPDVRSQVLEPNAIRAAGIQMNLGQIEDNNVHFDSYTGFSLNELMEKVYFDAGGNAELAVVFQGSVHGTYQLYSHKKINSYYCKARATKDGFYSFIDGPTVSANVKDHPEMLSLNFRKALARLGSNPTKIQMDSLINRYGTHVVTGCTLGGMMELDIRLEKDSIATVYRDKAIGEVALMSLYDHTNQSSTDQYDLQIVNSGDSRLTVRGGDSRTLEFKLMNFNWGRDAVSSQDVSAWLNSIGADEERRQTLEMTSMDIMGIWEFIPDPKVADMVEAHITGNAQLMLELYGYQNFVNTSFTAKPANNDMTGPDCYNIEADGRYVATLCREQIPEIDINGPVWVAYPIYQQQVNIDTGLCIHNGKAYRVGYRFGKMEVTPIDGEGYGNQIYMTSGYLYPISNKAVKYENNRVVVGYEWPGSITIGGSIDASKPVYLPYKQGGSFYLRLPNGTAQSGYLDGLPNWIYNGTLNRMVRVSDYYYYYNPLEVSYLNSHPGLYAK